MIIQGKYLQCYHIWHMQELTPITTVKVGQYQVFMILIPHSAITTQTTYDLMVAVTSSIEYQI